MSGEAFGETLPGGGGFSLLGSILQMIAALAVVVGLILLFYYLSNRFLKATLPAGTAQKYIRVLETRFIAPKKSLLLIEVGGEYLLMANSGEGLHFVKQIDMLEEIEVLEGPGIGSNLQNKIVDLVARFPKKPAKKAPLRASGGAR